MLKEEVDSVKRYLNIVMRVLQDPGNDLAELLKAFESAGNGTNTKESLEKVDDLLLSIEWIKQLILVCKQQVDLFPQSCEETVNNIKKITVDADKMLEIVNQSVKASEFAIEHIPEASNY